MSTSWLTTEAGFVTGVADYVGTSQRAPKTPCRPAEDAIIGFMKDFLAEKHGYAQKIPNPRAGHEEWHLPVWMTKHYVYNLMVASMKIQGNCGSGTLLIIVGRIAVSDYSYRFVV